MYWNIKYRSLDFFNAMLNSNIRCIEIAEYELLGWLVQRWIVTLDVLKYAELFSLSLSLYSWIVTLDVLK